MAHLEVEVIQFPGATVVTIDPHIWILIVDAAKKVSYTPTKSKTSTEGWHTNRYAFMDPPREIRNPILEVIQSLCITRSTCGNRF